MESYDAQENVEDALIMPIVVSAETYIPDEELFSAIGTGIIKYFEKEYFEDGHLPEQIFLEWLSDGAKIDLRLAKDATYYRNANENQVSITSKVYNLTFEPVNTLGELSHSFTSLPEYPYGEPVEGEAPSLNLSEFKVPLISVVVSEQETEGFQDILDQVSFTVSSIYFSLGSQDVENWRENNFKVEVFLEKELLAPHNSRVLTVKEETGGIASAGFWIE
jgi:hypothetical protein